MVVLTCFVKCGFCNVCVCVCVCVSVCVWVCVLICVCVGVCLFVMCGFVYVWVL